MAYIGTSPSNGVRRKHTYTATASQTSFSGAGAEGATLSYNDSNFVDVYQNGVKLSEADYTSTSGTAIVLATGATVSDMIEIVVYDVFSVADTVSKADGGQFDGNVTMAGTITVTGNADLNGDLDVDGTSNLDVVDIDGTLNVQGETTLQTHLNMGDNDTIKLGASADLQINHNSSSGNSFIKDVGAGMLILGSDGTGILLQKTSGETMGQFLTDGAVELYHDNSKKIETTSSGVTVTGSITSTNNMTMGADTQIQISGDGGSSGLQLLGQDSSASLVGTLGSQNLLFRIASAERLRLTTTGRLENQSPSNTGNVLQDFRIDFRNENNAGVMAGIGCVRTGNANAPGAFVIRTSTNVDSSSNSGDGEISEKFRVAANGDLTATDTSIASNSDSRLKENISDFAYDLDKFKSLKTKTFDWKNPKLHGEKSGQRGFIAQDIETVDNYWIEEIEVSADSDDFQYLEDKDILYTENSTIPVYEEGDTIPDGKKVGDAKYSVGDLEYKARFAKTSKLGQKDAMYVSIIQQLITKIETLEADVKTLKG